MRRRMSALGGKASVTQTPRGFVGSFVCLSTWSKYRPLSGRLRWENTSSASLSELSLPGILIWRGATCFSCCWGVLRRDSALQPPESLVPRRVDKETENSFFTERFGSFQPMQAFNEHEASAVRPYQDRRLQAPVEDARGDFVYALLITGGTPLDWHVDVCDREGLALHHAGLTSSIVSRFPAHE